MHQQSSRSTKKKLSTPALLFCKPRPKPSKYTCVNHPTKMAHYAHKVDNHSTYCERCANVLQDINITNEVMNHDRRVKQFRSQVDVVKAQLKQLLVGSQQFYGLQIQQINQYFGNVFQWLQFQKNKCYHAILNERHLAESSLRNKYKDVENLQQQLTQITQDIQDNIEAVYQIQQSSYRPVILEYADKLTQFQTKFELIRKVEVTQQKLLNVIPDSIMCLSSILMKKNQKESSCDSFNSQDTIKKYLQNCNANDH